MRVWTRVICLVFGGIAWAGGYSSYAGRDLTWSIMMGQATDVREALRTTTHLNSFGEDGDTLLHLAVLRGDFSIVEELLKEAQIDIHAQDRFGRSPISLLQERIALFQKDLDSPRNRTIRAETLEKLRTHLRIASLLLYHGAYRGHLDFNGNSLLHHAILYADRELLLALTSNPYITLFSKNSEGKTPYEIRPITSLLDAPGIEHQDWARPLEWVNPIDIIDPVDEILRELAQNLSSDSLGFRLFKEHIAATSGLRFRRQLTEWLQAQLDRGVPIHRKNTSRRKEKSRQTEKAKRRSSNIQKQSADLIETIVTWIESPSDPQAASLRKLLSGYSNILLNVTQPIPPHSSFLPQAFFLEHWDSWHLSGLEQVIRGLPTPETSVATFFFSYVLEKKIFDGTVGIEKEERDFIETVISTTLRFVEGVKVYLATDSPRTHYINQSNAEGERARTLLERFTNILKESQ